MPFSLFNTVVSWMLKKRIHQIESQVKHDVIAFLTSVTEKAGLKARYLHQGMTSSDVVDTSFNIQLVQSGKILVKDLDKEEFENLWTKLHWVYNEELNYVEVGEEILEESSY